MTTKPKKPVTKGDAYRSNKRANDAVTCASATSWAALLVSVTLYAVFGWETFVDALAVSAVVVAVLSALAYAYLAHLNETNPHR